MASGKPHPTLCSRRWPAARPEAREWLRRCIGATMGPSPLREASMRPELQQDQEQIEWVTSRELVAYETALAVMEERVDRIIAGGDARSSSGSSSIRLSIPPAPARSQATSSNPGAFRFTGPVAAASSPIMVPATSGWHLRRVRPRGARPRRASSSGLGHAGGPGRAAARSPARTRRTRRRADTQEHDRDGLAERARPRWRGQDRRRGHAQRRDEPRTAVGERAREHVVVRRDRAPGTGDDVGGLVGRQARAEAVGGDEDAHAVHRGTA